MAPRRARIVVADQQPLFRRSLAVCLERGGHAVVGEAYDGDTLDNCMIDAEPDIVLLDRYLPGVDGLTYCRMLNALQSDIQTLLLVAYEHEAHALQREAFLAGAAGCLSKELETDHYLAAVQQLMVGHLLFTPETMRRAALPQPVDGPAAYLQHLTPREREVLRLVAEGMGNREIAARLNVSYYTAMKHVSNIMAKLHVGNRVEAAMFAIHYGEESLQLGLAAQLHGRSPEGQRR